MKTKDINEAITWWRNANEEWAMFIGGYPPCINHLNGVIAIADENDNGSNLTMCDAETFIKWIQTAKNMKEAWDKANLEGDKINALWETQPKMASYLSH